MKKISLILILVFSCGFAAAEPPNLITYQGRLKESGFPVSGNRSIDIKICDALTAGTCYSASGAQSVYVSTGLFKSTFTVDSSVDLSAGSWYLELNVAGTPLSPRELLSSVPYALVSSTAVYANNLAPAANAQGVYSSTSIIVNSGNLTLSSGEVYIGSGANISTITATGFYGDGSNLTGVLASQIAAENVLAGSLGANVISSSIAVDAVYDGALLNPKVSKSGDTMTGQLTISGSSLTVISPDTDQYSLWVSTSATTSHLYVSTTGSVQIGGNNPNFKIKLSISRKKGEAYSLTSSADSPYYPTGTVVAIASENNSVNSGALIDFNAYNSINGASGVFIGGVAGPVTNGSANFVIGRRTAATSWAESLRIDTSGNLGIGTNGPSSKFDVLDGSITVRGTNAGIALETGSRSLLPETDALLGAGIRISTNVYIVGFSSAAKFFGDGSNLTGVTASGAVQKTGDTMTGQLTISGSSLTINVSGALQYSLQTSSGINVVAGIINTPAFKMPTGASNNYVLMTDANGNSRWADPSTSGFGDNVVGNEVMDAANTTLTRSGIGSTSSPYELALNLVNANTWTGLQTFNGGIGGDGSGITNLTAANIAAGSLGVNVVASSIAVSAVYSEAILDGTIIDADINASAAIAPSKISGTAAILGANTFTGVQTYDAGSSIASAALQPGITISTTIFVGAGANISTITATGFIGDGSGLTSLTAANIAAGSLGANVISSSIAVDAVYSEAILDGIILDADISASAAITATKLQSTVMIEGENVSLLTNDAGYLTTANSISLQDTLQAGATFYVSSGTVNNFIVGTNITLPTASVADAALSANVSLLGQTIESAEITDGTILDADISAISGDKITGTIVSTHIVDGTIIDADINASAAIAPTKISGTAAILGANTFTGVQTYDAGSSIASAALQPGITISTTIFVGAGANISTITPTGFIGDGSGLTNLTAANIAAGSLGSSVIASSIAVDAVYDGALLNPKVSKSGDTMTGSLALLNNSTLTVTGNAFSVGTDTLTVVNGNVGIGTTAPAEKLDVAGMVRSTWAFSPGDGNFQSSRYMFDDSPNYRTSFSSNVYIVGYSSATKFYGDGFNLTNLPVDDLGNHIATQNLNMSGFQINNVSTITVQGENIVISPFSPGGNYNYAISIGSGAYDNYNNGIGVGYNAYGNYTYGVGVGDNAYNNYIYGVGLGDYAYNNHDYGVGVGNNAANNYNYGVGVGFNAYYNYNYAVGIGAYSQYNASYGTGIGAYTTAASSSVALGYNAKANAGQSIAIGYNTVNDSTGTASFGIYAIKTSSNIVAVGSVTANGFYGDGSNLTNLTAANLVGTVPAASVDLSTVAGLGANTFTGVQTYGSGASITAATGQPGIAVSTSVFVGGVTAVTTTPMITVSTATTSQVTLCLAGAFETLPISGYAKGCFAYQNSDNIAYISTETVVAAYSWKPLW